MSPESVLESSYKKKLQGSAQLQTVLVTPSYQNLRTMVRQHIDQTFWTRNFKVR